MNNSKKYDEIISLGFDCTVSRMLEHYKLRKDAYPIDYTVSRDWNLVKNTIIHNDIDRFVDVEMVNGFYVNPDNVEFLHHSNISKIEFCEMFRKRFERLINVIKSDKSVLFIRKTHDENNCLKTQKNFDEIKETIEFCEYLNSLNPTHRFVLFNSCPNCNKITYSLPDNLHIIEKDLSPIKDSFGHYNKDIEDYIKKLI